MSAAESKLPNGFSCSCGQYHKFPLYVYSHWNESLTFTCDCGKKYLVRFGRAAEMKQLTRRRKQK